jgi:hypothetical protein
LEAITELKLTEEFFNSVQIGVTNELVLIPELSSLNNSNVIDSTLRSYHILDYADPMTYSQAFISNFYVPIISNHKYINEVSNDETSDSVTSTTSTMLELKSKLSSYINWKKGNLLHKI